MKRFALRIASAVHSYLLKEKGFYADIQYAKCSVPYLITVDEDDGLRKIKMLRGLTSKAARLTSWNRVSSVFIPAYKEFSPSRSCSTDMGDEAPPPSALKYQENGGLHLDDGVPSSSRPFRIHSDFAFDPEKDSLIKPMWRIEETEEELIWRAKVLSALLGGINYRSISAYTVHICGLTGLYQSPIKLAELMYKLAFKKSPKPGLPGVTSQVRRPKPDRLKIIFASMDAKHEFLRAAPMISRIKNRYNNGENLRVTSTDNAFEDAKTGIVKYRDFDRLRFLDPEFDFHISRIRFPHQDSKNYSLFSDSAKVWTELLELQMRRRLVHNASKTISFDVEGSIEPYEQLKSKERAEIGEEILNSMSANSEDIANLSYLSVNDPFAILDQDSGKRSVFLEFKDMWPISIVLARAPWVAKIPDPLNPGKELKLREKIRSRDLRMPLEERETDDSLPGLTRRLNLVENALKVECYNEYVKRYRMDISEESELEELQDPKRRDELARRLFRRDFNLHPDFVDELSLETFLGSRAATLFSLEIKVQKHWQAEYLRERWPQTKPDTLGPWSVVSPVRDHATRMATTVQAYLEKEKGVQSEMYFADYDVPYLVTPDEDGEESGKAFNRFGLTREAFDRHAPPDCQWGGGKTVDGGDCSSSTE